MKAIRLNIKKISVVIASCVAVTVLVVVLISLLPPHNASTGIDEHIPPTTESPKPDFIPVTDVTLDKSSYTLEYDGNFLLTASVIPDDATDRGFLWESSDPMVASVDTSGSSVTVKAVGYGDATITVTCGGMNEACMVKVNPPKVAAVTLNKSSETLEIGKSFTLVAAVAPENVPDPRFSWESSDPLVAEVKTNGEVVAVGAGLATVTVTCDEKTAVCIVTVNSPEVLDVVLDQSSITLEIGEELTLLAAITPDNIPDPLFSWESSDPSVATVDEIGKVTAVSAGAATITVTCGEKHAECIVTVNPLAVKTEYKLNRSNLSLDIGRTSRLSVTPDLPSDIAANWTSNNSSIASVDRNGNVRAVATGSATITVSFGDERLSCRVTVTDGSTIVPVSSVTLTASSLKLNINESSKLSAKVSPDNATDKSLSWSSSNSSVVSVSQSGNVAAHAQGTATITVSCGGKQATCSITVTSDDNRSEISVAPSSATIEIGGTLKLTATVTPNNGERVSWKSSKTSVATVDSNGNVTAVGPGSVTITASCNNAKSASCSIVVS